MITLEEALDYFENERLFGEKFLELDPNKQNQALKMAENQIMNLKFNSYVDENRDKRIMRAICEQALHLLENSQRQKLINAGVTSFSVEGLSETYATNGNPQKAYVICFEAMEYISPYLVKVASIC